MREMAARYKRSEDERNAEARRCAERDEKVLGKESLVFAASHRGLAATGSHGVTTWIGVPEPARSLSLPGSEGGADAAPARIRHGLFAVGKNERSSHVAALAQ